MLHPARRVVARGHIGGRHGVEEESFWIKVQDVESQWQLYVAQLAARRASRRPVDQ